MSESITADFTRRFPGGPEIRVEGLRTPDGASVSVLFGASGVGKTTVLRCLAGLEKPDEGALHFGEEVWSDARRDLFVPPRARRIGFVPQEYALFPHLSVARNLGYGLGRMTPNERRARIAEMLRWLGLDGLEQRFPRELSGGQQQRVALARAVARRPRLLLLDEPLAALDAPTRVRLRGELRRLLTELRIPTLLVTHDRTEALTLGDHLVVMAGGRVVQQGPTLEVFNRPSSLEVASIVAVETILPGRVLETGELVTVELGGKTLRALGGDLPAGTIQVFVCIRAEDVILMRGDAVRSSPRNCLPAVVKQLLPEGPMVRIGLDCGFPLMAALTRQACAELALAEGEQVLALVKAPQIHLIPR